MRHSDLPDEINEVTGDIVDAAIAVHRALGPGLLEHPYEVALASLLRRRGRHVAVQAPIGLEIEGVEVPVAYRADLIVDGVLVEIKAADRLTDRHRMQVVTYLRLGRFPVGLLINFHEDRLKDGIERILPPRVRAWEISATPPLPPRLTVPEGEPDPPMSSPEPERR